MVFFVCSLCGSCLKKNQVEKHWNSKCGQNKVVSCMDCSKEFVGQAYASHLKCVTEDEKYGGTNYKPKEMKGEKKQDEWVTLVQNKVSSSTNMEPQLKKLLDAITKFNNLPRKKQKFKNFVLNSTSIKNPGLIEQAWNIFEQVLEEMKNNKNNAKNNNDNDKNKSNNDKNSTVNGNNSTVNNGTANGTVNGNNKRKREEKTDKDEESKQKKNRTENGSQNGEKNKENGEKTDKEEESKQKKNKTENGNQNGEKNKENGENGEKKMKNEENGEKKMKNGEKNNGEFKWKDTINSILKNSQNDGMKTKKLRQKVISKFKASKNVAEISDEKLIEIFNQKIQGKKFVVLNDKVMLKKRVNSG